jgi:hypothetical protein
MFYVFYVLRAFSGVRDFSIYKYFSAFYIVTYQFSLIYKDFCLFILDFDPITYKKGVVTYDLHINYIYKTYIFCIL